MSEPIYFYPQKMGKVIFLGLEEVIGRSGGEALLNLAALDQPGQKISFDTVSQLQAALELAYGPRGGRGLALRTGRACFKYSTFPAVWAVCFRRRGTDGFDSVTRLPHLV